MVSPQNIYLLRLLQTLLPVIILPEVISLINIDRISYYIITVGNDTVSFRLLIKQFEHLTVSLPEV